VAKGPHDPIDPNKLFPNSLAFMENSFLAFFQGLFANFPVGRYHYDQDPNLTEIAIEGQNTENLRTIDTRPKIVVARGAVSMQKSGIANFIGSRNVSLESRQYAHIRAGTVGISCYNRNDLEADRIAEICASSIESLAPVIRNFGFLEVRTTDIGQRAMIKSDAIGELFVTPVLVRASVTMNYKSKIVDPVKLQSIIYQYVIEPVGLTIPSS
jgi:hypothetical protein